MTHTQSGQICALEQHNPDLTLRYERNFRFFGLESSLMEPSLLQRFVKNPFGTLISKGTFLCTGRKNETYLLLLTIESKCML